MPPQPPVAARMRDIQPFHVMSLLARARELEAGGRSIVHMEIGEPDFSTPKAVIDAGIAALRAGQTHYTPAQGLPRLREAIAAWYRERDGVDVDPARIFITPGASGALQLVTGVLIEPGSELLMADPGYPCNRNFVRLAEGRARSIAVGAEQAYQLTPALVAANWSDKAAGVLVGSPANPTGTLIGDADLRAIYEIAQARGGALIVDEIYHGLVYEDEYRSALALSEQIFVVNSFSKYFGMTGWRIGWLVVPEAYCDAVHRLAQNIFLAASTPAQHAAIAAFQPESIEVLEQRRAEFQKRRDYLLPALRELGFGVPFTPQGAFYIYADCGRFTDDSFRFSRELLEQAGVAITPGIDFGDNQPKTHVRFAYTTSLERLREGVARIGKFVAK